MMRTQLLLILFCVSNITCKANTQKIKVLSDDGNILPFSYVYINGKPFGTADKEAETYIPTSLLKDGDFISASYVGYNTTSTEYSDPKPEGYTITMSRSSLERVVIYSQQETRKEFREIRHMTPMARASDFMFEFIFDINGEKYCSGSLYHYFRSNIREVWKHNYCDEAEAAKQQGRFRGTDTEAIRDVPITDSTNNELYYQQYDNMHNRIYTELSAEFIPLLKDKAYVDKLQKDAIPIMQNMFYTASRAVATDLMFVEICGVRRRKVGEDGRIRQFVLSREGNGRMYDGVVSSMVLINVDTLIYDIKESRMNITKRNGRIELAAKYSRFNYFRYPSVIEATYFMNNGVKYSMVIYNVRPTYGDKIRTFRKYNSVNIWDTDNELIDAGCSSLRVWKSSITKVLKEPAFVYPDIMFKELSEEIRLGAISELLLRERLEMYGLINSVWQ